MPSRFGERQRMTVLAFDCAVSGLAVAVVRDGVGLAERREEGRDQAATLLPAIAATLQEAGVDRRTLSLIAVTVGPGSFTGVRVGLAAARGLAVALDVPLAGITTTAALLAAAPNDDRLAVAAIDTHLGDWFCAIREATGAVRRLDRGAGGAGSADRPCRIVGPQAEALAPQVPRRDRPAGACPIRSCWRGSRWPTASRRGAYATGPKGLPRPLYLRGVNVTSPDGTRRTVE